VPPPVLPPHPDPPPVVLLPVNREASTVASPRRPSVLPPLVPSPTSTRRTRRRSRSFLAALERRRRVSKPAEDSPTGDSRTVRVPEELVDSRLVLDRLVLPVLVVRRRRERGEDSSSVPLSSRANTSDPVRAVAVDGRTGTSRTARRPSSSEATGSLWRRSSSRGSTSFALTSTSTRLRRCAYSPLLPCLLPY
jgi:hypothetical protein